MSELASEVPGPAPGPARLRVARIVSVVAAGFLGAAVGVTALQVVLRFAFNMPFAWAEEVGRYLFVWSVYAGFLLAVVRNTHIRVNVFIDTLPPRAVAWIGVGIRLLSVCAFAFVAWKGAGLALNNLGREFYTIPFLTLVWFYLSVPLFMTLACLYLLIEPFLDGKRG